MNVGDQVFHIIAPWQLWVVVSVKDTTIRVTKQGDGVIETKWFELGDSEWRTWSQVDSRSYPGASIRRQLVNR